MSFQVTVANQSYTLPETGDSLWGDQTSLWMAAISTQLLQKSGGIFSLTAEVDFGVTFGLKSAYFKSRGTNPATAGVLRLAQTDSIAFRNGTNNANLLLAVNEFDRLTFDGAEFLTAVGTLTANRVLISDGSGDIASSSVSTTTLGYLDATSSIQTQLNGKQATGNYMTSVTGEVTGSGPGATNTTVSNAAVIAKVLTAFAAAPGTVSSTDSILQAIQKLSGNDTLLQPRKNSIINGAFDFFQRTQSLAFNATDSGYVADRFRFSFNLGTFVGTGQRSTDVPTLAQSGFQSSYSLLLDVSTAESSIAAGELGLFSYYVEGYDYAPLKGQQATLSFWVKATKTGTYCVSFRNNGNDRSYVAEYVVNTTNTWEKKTVTLTFNPTGGTDNFTNGVGLDISWILACGSTFQTSANSWQSGNYLATSNQVNGLDSTSNDFRIAQVMLNIGSSAAPFGRAGELVQKELALCQRYFEKSWDTDTPVQTTTPEGSRRIMAITNSAGMADTVNFAVEKRAQPLCQVYSPADGAGGNFRNTSAGANAAASAGQGVTGTRGFACATTSAASGAGAVYIYQWTADAEL